MAVRDMGRSESAREVRGSLTKRLFVQSLAERKERLRKEQQLSAAHRHKGGAGEW